MTESEVIKEKIKGYSSIVYLQWHITERCEERCRHCYIGTENQNLGLSENKRIVDLFASYGAKKTSMFLFHSRVGIHYYTKTYGI